MKQMMLSQSGAPVLISHTSIQYMDFREIFSVSLNLSGRLHF